MTSRLSPSAPGRKSTVPTSRSRPTTFRLNTSCVASPPRSPSSSSRRSQYGYYPSFLEYPGSISIGAGTFKNVVMDICKSMRGYGLKKFYVLNTGVSTIGPLAEAEKELAADGITLRSLNVLEVDRELPAGLLKQEGGTHADEGETSMMLYIAPETVDMSKAAKDFDPRPGRRGLTRDPKGEGSYSPTGIYGDPTLAYEGKGPGHRRGDGPRGRSPGPRPHRREAHRPCRREIRGFTREDIRPRGPVRASSSGLGEGPSGRHRREPDLLYLRA